MDLRIFQSMEKNELISYLEFLFWHYRVVDAFWFIKVAEQFDQEIAERLNESVWSRVPRMAAEDLVKRFGIQEKGLKGFLKALKLFPWTVLVEYQIEEKKTRSSLVFPTVLPRRQDLGEDLMNLFANTCMRENSIPLPMPLIQPSR